MLEDGAGALAIRSPTASRPRRRSSSTVTTPIAAKAPTAEPVHVAGRAPSCRVGERRGGSMPYAINRVDGVRTYFEDADGASRPVLLYTGFADPLEVAKSSRLARALSGEFHLVFADHRGQGASDRPREASAHAPTTRVGDAVASSTRSASSVPTSSAPRGEPGSGSVSASMPRSGCSRSSTATNPSCHAPVGHRHRRPGGPARLLRDGVPPDDRRRGRSREHHGRAARLS